MVDKREVKCPLCGHKWYVGGGIKGLDECPWCGSGWPVMCTVALRRLNKIAEIIKGVHTRTDGSVAPSLQEISEIYRLARGED
jgi:hypothetical protein